MASRDSVAALIAHAVEKPDAPAVICGEQHWSRQHLLACATRLAAALQADGVGRGDRVAVLIERSPEMVASLLAVWLVGAAFIPIDGETPPERLNLILDDAEPRALITQSRLAVRVSQSLPLLLRVDRLPAEADAAHFVAPELRADDTAYLIYTSGSTGRPKGAINRGTGVDNLYRWFAGCFGMGPQTRSLIISSIGFDQTHKAIWAPLMAGGVVVLLETPYYDPQLIRDTAERHGATMMSCTPSAFYGLIDDCGERGWAQLGSLTQVFPIGEALRYERLRAWAGNAHNRAEVINTYGPTECADVLSYFPLRDYAQDGIVPLGTAIDGVHLAVLGADNEPLTNGETGELVAWGICVGDGYRNLPEQTANAFIEHPLAPGQRVYRSGDLVHRDADGVYHYHGRRDHQVKIRGHRIELQEVESVLGRHPDVAEAVCAAIEDQGDAFLAAWLRLKPGRGLDVAGLRQHMRRSLPDYMTPSAFNVLERFPVNASGKLDRKALPKPTRGRPPVATAWAPAEGPLETAVLGLWEQVLGFGGVGVEDRFFELGGTSLQAIQVCGRLSRLMDVRVPIAQFFATPTVRGLAAWIGRAHAPAASRWLGVPLSDAQTQRVVRARREGGSGDVAIIGMAARLPGADDLEAFWDLLIEGREGMRPLSDAELDAAGVPDAQRRSPQYVKVAGALTDADCFDAAFFGLSAREAEMTDPQHRILLELAWQAFEHAGFDPARQGGRVGVYAGVARNAYLTNNIASHIALRLDAGDYTTMLGNDKDYVATRIAFKLGLSGPALAVQTACSSSGVALHLACQALRAGECDAALVGGGRIISPVQGGYQHIEGGPLSADGSIRPFDADATGMVRTSGMAAVLLMPVEAALAAGHSVYAVIKGSALNNDGAAKAGYTAPSVDGQAEVLEQALANAGVSADSVHYIEAHGTATPVGDPIEFSALQRVYGAAQTTPGSIALGAVKSNIGHLDAGAAVVGVIKTALSLSRSLIPPTLHYRRANPEIDFAASPFEVVTQARPWPIGATLRAAVSSFGIGGTNAHLILEEPPKMLGTTPPERPLVLRLSARSETALAATAARLADWLERHPEAELADVAYTLDVGRARLPLRAAVAAREPADAIHALRALPSAQRPVSSAPKLVFGFPGQGAQHPGMGEALYRQSPVFRAALDHCAEALKAPLGVDLRELMYPQANAEAAADALRDTQLAQPALFAVAYATAQHWLAQGVEPEALIGHSVGEWVAATLAGVFALDDALALLVERARLMASMEGGGMLAVRVPEAEIAAWLGDTLDLAAVNAPQLCVVAGPHAELDALVAKLDAAGIGHWRLHTSHAFHSRMMTAAVAPLAAAIAQRPRHPAQQRIASTVTGTWATDDELMDPMHWATQLTRPVRFADALKCALSGPGYVLLEVGSGQTLTTSSRQQLPEGSRAVASLPHAAAEGADAHLHAQAALGQLWCAGFELPLERAYAGELRRKVGLPGYAFDRTRHWIEPAAMDGSAVEALPPVTAAPETATVEAIADPYRAGVIQVLADCTGARIPAAQHADTWLSLGMDSLLLTQVAGKLKSRFKIDIKFRELLETHTSVDKLTDHLARVAAEPVREAPPPPAWNDAPKVDAEPVPAVPAKAFGAQAKISKRESSGLSARQQAALEAFSARYVARTGKSKAYAQTHRAHLADPRTVSGFRPLFKELIYPIVTERSDGAYLWDLDGHRYIDVTNGFGCIFFGHRPDFVVEAVQKQLQAGFEIGPQTPLAGECAELFTRFTGLPRVAFCNTGSEAVLAAMRMARTVSGRDLILMHTNDYHGIQDEVIVRPGPGGVALPASPGIPRESTQNIVIKDYGDPATLAWVAANADRLAAVLVEPVQSRNADLQPADYLRRLREITAKADVALIMDEVITGFRSHLGGAQAYFGVKADIATYGKVFGGGLPVGAVAGTERYMDTLDGGFWRYGDDSVPETGVTYFAGTFVRHPLTMAAVRAVLHWFDTHEPPQAALAARTEAMVEEINAYLQRVGAPVHIAHFTSLLRAQFTREQPFGELFFLFLREAGLHIFEGRPCFLTLAHTDADVDAIIRAFRYATEQMLAGDFFVDAGFTPEQAMAISANDPYASPAPGARIGVDADGNPAWFVPGENGVWQAVTSPEAAA